MAYDFSTQVPYRRRKTINIKLKKEGHWLHYDKHYPLDNYYAKPLYTPRDHMDEVIRHYNIPIINFRGLKKKSSTRDVLFIPNVAFGLASCRDLTFEAQRQKERNQFVPMTITGTRRFNAQVLPQRAVCRVTGLTAKERGIKTIKLAGVEIIPTQRKSIHIRLKKKRDLMKEMSEPVWIDPSKVIRPKKGTLHIKLKGSKTSVYSPWTRDIDADGYNFTVDTGDNFAQTGEINWANDINGNDIINVGDLTFDSTEDAPIDLISASNRAFALESIAEEAKLVLGSTDSGSLPTTSNMLIDVDGIDAWKGYGTLTNKTLSSDVLLSVDTRPTITIRLKGAKYYQSVPCTTLTYDGLMKAKKIIEDEWEDEDDY